MPRPIPPRAANFTGVYTGYVLSVLSNMTITVASTGGAAGHEPSLTAVFAWGETALPANLYAGPTDDSAVLSVPASLPIPCMVVI